LKPTKPAVQISDADRRRNLKILITGKCTMTFKKWRDKGGESPGEPPGRSVQVHCTGRSPLSLTVCLYQITTTNTIVTKTKTALKQETYNLSDLKHDLHCGFVELGDSLRFGLGRIGTRTNTIGSNNSKVTTIALSLSSSLLMWEPSFC
jgi:hypothetical protein